MPLFFNIAAKRVEKRSMLRVLLATYIHALQRIRLLQVAKVCCCACCAFYRPEANLFFISVSNIDFSSAVSGFCQVFSFNSNVAKQVARFCCQYYRNLTLPFVFV